jgi:RND family efflux transporter MFP subunit
MKKTIPAILLGATLLSATVGGMMWSSSAIAQPGGVLAGEKSQLVRGTTAPQERRKFKFDVRGIVEKSFVKKGDRVAKGQPLIKLNDGEERGNYEAQKANADVALLVAEAEQQAIVSQLDYDLTMKRDATSVEVAQAKAKMEIDKIKVEQARRQGIINQGQADAAKARLEKMSILSTIDGIVVDVYAKDGEGVDEQKDIVEVINRDVLYIDVRLADLQTVRGLKVGQELRVKFPTDSDFRKAKIRHIAPEADAKAGTLPFQLEMPNPDQREPGEDISVEIPAVPGVAAANGQ